MTSIFKKFINMSWSKNKYYSTLEIKMLLIILYIVDNTIYNYAIPIRKGYTLKGTSIYLLQNV